MYVRVSTDDKGQTVENQRLPLQEFCRAQGWTEVTEYADEASATDLRGRVQWRRLLDDCAKRKVDLVIVWRLDRAFRSVLDAAQTLERLRAWGVGIRSYQEPWLDTTSPFGEALYYITVAYAQLARAGEGRDGPGEAGGEARREAAGDGAAGVRGEVGAGGARDSRQPSVQGPGSTAVEYRLRYRPAAAADGEGRRRIVSRRRASGPAVRVTYDRRTPPTWSVGTAWPWTTWTSPPASPPTSTGGGACSGSRSSTPRGTCGRSSPALLPTRAGPAATTETGTSGACGHCSRPEPGAPGSRSRT